MVLAVACGGALGAVGRYLISSYYADSCWKRLSLGNVDGQRPGLCYCRGSGHRVGKYLVPDAGDTGLPDRWHDGRFDNVLGILIGGCFDD